MFNETVGVEFTVESVNVKLVEFIDIYPVGKLLYCE